GVYMLVTTEDSVKAGQDKIYTQLAPQDTTGLFYRNDIGSKAIK
ncbi:phosphoribosylamine--glycine ligase, partial [Streptococcus agalactiae]